MNKPITSHITKGLIIAGVLIALAVTTRLAHINLYTDPAFAWIRVGLLIIGFAFSGWIFAKQLNGETSFGPVFAHGFKTAAVTVALLAVFAWISYKFIFPDIRTETYAAAKEQMIQEKNIMPSEIDARAKDAADKGWIFYVAQELFPGLICGLIGASLGAVAAKKNQ